MLVNPRLYFLGVAGGVASSPSVDVLTAAGHGRTLVWGEIAGTGGCEAIIQYKGVVFYPIVIMEIRP